jgi:hypothetical protein
MVSKQKIPGGLNPLRTRKWLLAAAMGWLLCTSDARAALASDLASVQSDAQAFGALTSQTMLAAATVYSQTLPNGLVVRQYVDAAGLVFAVGWEGPVLPDFARLLGPYYPVYTLAVRQQKRGVNIQTPELVIESGGMMRSFSGRALLPARLPAAMAPLDIR